MATNIYKQTTGQYLKCLNFVILNLFLDLELPDCSNQNRDDTNSSCRVCVIKWLAGYTQDIKQKHYPNIPMISKDIG